MTTFSKRKKKKRFPNDTYQSNQTKKIISKFFYGLSENYALSIKLKKKKRKRETNNYKYEIKIKVNSNP